MSILFTALLLCIHSLLQIEDMWSFVMFYVFYALVVAEFCLHLWADKKALPQTRKERDKERVPLLSPPQEEMAEEKVTLLSQCSTMFRLNLPSRHKTLNECWFTVGPPSTTLDQRQTNIHSTS